MTPKVEFKLDKEKDLFNIWETCNSKESYGYDFKKNISKETLIICQHKKFEDCKENLKKRREEIYLKPTTKISINATEEAWRTIEKKYFQTLKKITKENFPFEKIRALPTTAPRCPYRPHWRPPAYYFSLFSSIEQQLLISGHELMHIQLHNTSWWKRVENQIGYDRTHDLKEALTELLNLEFKKLLIFPDMGYPNHQQLRKYIAKKWKEKKDFNLLTESCIKWIKRNGIK